MIIFTKKLFFALTLNAFLFLTLIVGMQNSSTKSKVNLILNETIELPISFIVGISLIGGSLFGIFIPLNIFKEKNRNL